MNENELRKRRLFDIIEVQKEKDAASHAYDLMIIVTIIVGMIPLMFKEENIFTTLIDLFAVAIFLYDYLIRVYTADYKMGFMSYKAYMAYLVTPLAIIDLLSVLPILTFFITVPAISNVLHILRVCRIMKLVRYSKTMVSITNMIRRVKKQLSAVLLLTLVYILASAMIIFQVEPDTFDNFFEAVYWATISITTIGYGDISPVSTVGKLITIISALVGVAVIALPTGIITAAYVDEIKKKKSKLEL